MSSCWKINLSIYFRQRHLCHWRHYLFQSFGPSRVKSGCINWLLLRSFGFFCIWSPQFILNTRLWGHSTVSRSTLYSWLIPLWPFDIGMGFLRGCILSIHTAWSVLTLKLTEKTVLFKLWSNVTYLQHVYVNGHGIGKHEFSLHERQKLRDEELFCFFNSLLTLR